MSVLREEDIASLRCLDCAGPLAFRGFLKGQRLWEGGLRCNACAMVFPVEGGVARLFHEREVRGTDRLMRVAYDGMPWFHDPLVRFSFPLAVGENEAESRERYFARLALDRLAARRDEPIRILEVGLGTGGNVPILRQKLAGRGPVELWGVDLSLGMLEWARRRLVFLGDDETRYLAADAHRLPFPAGFFDRVFHVGAINGYREPARALAEMARVARPGTPIVVVDERLDPERRHGLLQRLFFKMMTFYDRNPHAPVELLPVGASEVTVDQLGRFFYCLTFTVPPAVAKKAVKPAAATLRPRAAIASGKSSSARPAPPASPRPRRRSPRPGPAPGGRRSGRSR